jgi:rhamnogalacturonan endolyase
MLYLNSGGGTNELWLDAKKKAATECAAWPYEWMNHPLYPHDAGRATVSGRLRVTDPQDAAASPAGAWVGLAAPAPDWQQQAGGYQFWVRADTNGAFEIPHVRPGTYALYAFVDGVMDEFQKTNVTVAGGSRLDLGTLDWKPVRHGRQLWQIGVPDRTAREFRHGDDYRQWGLWNQYPQDFPNGVNFIIGRNQERTDWNYAQVCVQTNGTWTGTRWNILFDLDAALKPGTATLRLAFASTHAARVRVSVNDSVAGDTGRLGSDNAIIRAGIHGQYSISDIRFDAGLLKPGRNRITLEQTEGGNSQKGVMYDCIRLEVPDPM